MTTAATFALAALLGIAAIGTSARAYPAAAKNGLIAFQRGDPPAGQIWTIKPNGTGQKRFTSGILGSFAPKWSTDGRQIAFLKTSVGPMIYVEPAAGGKQRRLLPTSVQEAIDVAWSPVGGRVAFDAIIGQRAGLFSADTNGRGLKLVVPIPLQQHAPGGGPVAPAYSLDGKKLTYTDFSFRAASGSTSYSIWIVSSDGSNRHKLLDVGSAVGTPDPTGVTSAWAPNGKLIAVTELTTQGKEIYAVKPDGSDPQDLSNSPGDDAFPAWSPDGRRIAFASNRDGSFHLYTMKADGSDQIQLTRGSLPETAPDWQRVP